MTLIKENYQKNVLPQLMEKFNLTNPWAAPRLEKVVLNMGLGEAVDDKKIITRAFQTLAVITGQKPKVTKARQAISTFKLRKGMPIGVMATLRGKRMDHFLEKLMRIVLPRLRDFQGLSRQSFDGRGNYSLGLQEQLVFPEVEYEMIDAIRGLQITIVTTAESDDQAEMLLELLGMPFAKKEDDGQ